MKQVANTLKEGELNTSKVATKLEATQFKEQNVTIPDSIETFVDAFVKHTEDTLKTSTLSTDLLDEFQGGLETYTNEVITTITTVSDETTLESNLTSKITDIQTDDATYSFRAIGYLDYMDSQLQTTPIDWFEKIPAWSKLSFHDAPPLVFAIQYSFFKLFGISTFVARLPFALAGLGSVILLYFIGQRLYNEKVGLLASFLLTIFSYHTWASKVGYLETMYH